MIKEQEFLLDFEQQHYFDGKRIPVRFAGMFLSPSDTTCGVRFKYPFYIDRSYCGAPPLLEWHEATVYVEIVDGENYLSIIDKAFSTENKYWGSYIPVVLPDYLNSFFVFEEERFSSYGCDWVFDFLPCMDFDYIPPKSLVIQSANEYCESHNLPRLKKEEDEILSRAYAFYDLLAYYPCPSEEMWQSEKESYEAMIADRYVS